MGFWLGRAPERGPSSTSTQEAAGDRTSFARSVACPMCPGVDVPRTLLARSPNGAGWGIEMHSAVHAERHHHELGPSRGGMVPDRDATAWPLGPGALSAVVWHVGGQLAPGAVGEPQSNSQQARWSAPEFPVQVSPKSAHRPMRHLRRRGPDLRRSYPPPTRPPWSKQRSTIAAPHCSTTHWQRSGRRIAAVATKGRHP